MPSGIFLPLEVDFDEDEAVARLARYTRPREARACRDLLVAMWRHCKRKRTDGHVALEIVGKLAYPDSVQVAIKDADRLVEIGLAERTESGYFLPGFLKHNKSSEQLDDEAAQRAAEGSESGSLGNHIRWHVKARKSSPDCRHCIGSASGLPDRPPIAPDRDPIGSASLIDIDRDIATDKDTSRVKSRGQRNETSDAPRVTERPEDARCTAHTGVPIPPACRGCMAAREAAETALTAAKRDAVAARQNCRRCGGSGWIETADGSPAAKCDHRPPLEVVREDLPR